MAHKRSLPTVLDYFVASRSVSTFALVGTILATMINTLAVTGVPALVYKGGILYCQMFVIGIIAPSCISIFGRKIWRYGKEHNIFTQGEIFGRYYNSSAIKLCVAVIGLISVFPFMTIQLSAVGKVFSAATSGALSYELAVLASSVSIGGYLYLGGSRAVVWTDMIQAFIFLLIIVISAILFTYWSGGYVDAVSKLQATIPDKLTFNSTNTPIFIDNILSWPFAFFLWPQLFQRMFMAESERALSRSVSWNFILFNLIVLCTMTMGIMATATLYGQVQDADQIVAMMFQRFYPLGAAFIVIAVFATGMSTVDSILLTCSSIVNRDIITLVRKSFLSNRSEFKMAQTIAIAFLLLSTAFALSEVGRGAMTPLVTLGASFATLFLWPLLDMFYFKTLGKSEILLTMLAGVVAICTVKITSIGSSLGIGVGAAGFTVSLTVFLFCLIRERFLIDRRLAIQTASF